MEEEHDEYADKTTLVRSTQRSRFGADGIVRHTIMEGSELMADEARDILRLHSKQIGGKKLRIVVDPGGVAFPTHEVRQTFSQPETVKLIKAVALLTTSGWTRMMANLSFAFKKPEIPVKFFTNEEDAVKWLQTFPL
jgi:hypothetical protein